MRLFEFLIHCENSLVTENIRYVVTVGGVQLAETMNGQELMDKYGLRDYKLTSWTLQPNGLHGSILDIALEEE